jgi:hypothetical protein
MRRLRAGAAMSAAKRTRKARNAKRQIERHLRRLEASAPQVSCLTVLAYELTQAFITQRTRPAPPEAVSSAVMALPVDRTPEARALYRLRIQNLLLSLPQGHEPQDEAPHG